MERKPYFLASLKLVRRIKLLSDLALGIENSFPDRITRMSFYQKYYQFFLHRKLRMKEKKFLVAGPPDSGKASWFTLFQGMLINIVVYSFEIVVITSILQKIDHSELSSRSKYLTLSTAVFAACFRRNYVIAITFRCNSFRVYTRCKPWSQIC